jgi:hypothetical protein
MNHPETTVQTNIVQALSLLGVFFFMVPNDAAGKCTIQRRMRLLRMGLYPGMSDLCLVSHSGVVHFLEVKAEGGRLSPDQKKFRAFCALKGWPYGVAHDVDEAVSQCRAWGLVR